MSAGDAVKAAAVLFVAAIMQVSIFAQAHILHGVPDLLLVTLVSVALLRGTRSEERRVGKECRL